MTTATNSENLKSNFALALLTAVALAFIALASVPSWRQGIKETLLGSRREVLAKIAGSLTAEGPHITVLKLLNQGSLDLEVYSNGSDAHQILLAKLPLTHNRDGYLLVQGNATNLALVDVDKDGELEILAPTYDEQMVPRLNIFKYSKVTKSFDRVTAPDDFNP